LPSPITGFPIIFGTDRESRRAEKGNAGGRGGFLAQACQGRSISQRGTAAVQHVNGSVQMKKANSACFSELKANDLVRDSCDSRCSKTRNEFMMQEAQVLDQLSRSNVYKDFESRLSPPNKGNSACNGNGTSMRTYS
jgi:hypothetical protein